MCVRLTRRTVVDDASLPRNLQPLVPLLAAEEFLHLADDTFLHAFLQDHVIPRAVLHTLPQLLVLAPNPAVEHQDLIVGLAPVLAGDQQKGVVGFGGGTEEVGDIHIVVIVSADDIVQDVIGIRPCIDEAAELDDIGQSPVGARTASGGWDIAAPFQIGRDRLLLLRGCSWTCFVCGGRNGFGVTGCGESKEVGIVGGGDGQVEARVCFSQGCDNERVGVHPGSGRVVLEDIVDRTAVLLVFGVVMLFGFMMFRVVMIGAVVLGSRGFGMRGHLEHWRWGRGVFHLRQIVNTT